MEAGYIPLQPLPKDYPGRATGGEGRKGYDESSHELSAKFDEYNDSNEPNVVPTRRNVDSWERMANPSSLISIQPINRRFDLPINYGCFLISLREAPDTNRKISTIARTSLI